MSAYLNALMEEGSRERLLEEIGKLYASTHFVRLRVGERVFFYSKQTTANQIGAIRSYRVGDRGTSLRGDGWED
jgi:hypothetical protein